MADGVARKRGNVPTSVGQEPIDLMAQAMTQFPILQNLDLQYKLSPGARQGFLEFWPEQEIGSPDYPRPKEFPIGKVGVEVYDQKTRPIDIMGDVASHHLVKTDPRMKEFYGTFEKSLTADQKAHLMKQYQHAKVEEGEMRPYSQWYDASGLPGYFRGYAFNQWDRPDEMYSKDQLQMFDTMMNYLRGLEK